RGGLGRRLPLQPQPLRDARSVGGARQPDPSLPELGVARRCVQQARARHEPRHSRWRRRSSGRAHRSDGGAVRQAAMTLAPIYLDHNATTPPKPAVVAAVAAALGCVGNPSSVHRFGRCARRQVEDAREAVAALVGARPAQGIFTASATEANNLAVRGLTPSRRVLMSAVGQDPVVGAVEEAERVPVSEAGVVDLAALERALTRDPRPALVAVMLANNETRVIQPVAEAARIAHAHGALLLCDAGQAAGQVPVAMAGGGCDVMTLSAHRLGGPQGAAALIVADHVMLTPLTRGGGQERSRRAGTENVAAIAGFGVAAKLAREDLPRLAAL